MLTLEHAGKSYNGRQVIDSVTLRLNPGERLCLIGPSGSGKTTLMEIIAGIAPLDRGTRTVSFARIGYAFQDDALIPWRTARENILFGLSGIFGREDAENRASEWLNRFGLGKDMDKKPNQLSGGMRRRLNLARCMAMSPDLILLDEPFAFLDDTWQAEVFHAVTEEAEQLSAAVILAGHVPGLVSRLNWPEVRLNQAPTRIHWPSRLYAM